FAPGPEDVHGACPSALLNAPMFVPTTQRVPVQVALKDASPGAKWSLNNSVSVQSASPGSRKNIVPLKPPPATSREPHAAIKVMFVAWAGPNALPYECQVPPFRLRTQAPEPSVAT